MTDPMNESTNEPIHFRRSTTLNKSNSFIVQRSLKVRQSRGAPPENTKKENRKKKLVKKVGIGRNSCNIDNEPEKKTVRKERLSPNKDVNKSDLGAPVRVRQTSTPADLKQTLFRDDDSWEKIDQEDDIGYTSDNSTVHVDIPEHERLPMSMSHDKRKTRPKPVVRGKENRQVPYSRTQTNITHNSEDDSLEKAGKAVSDTLLFIGAKVDDALSSGLECMRNK
jgi:hypothetical protein